MIRGRIFLNCKSFDNQCLIFFQNYSELYQLYTTLHSSRCTKGKTQSQNLFRLQSLALNTLIRYKREDLNLGLPLPWRIFCQSECYVFSNSSCWSVLFSCGETCKSLWLIVVLESILRRRGEGISYLYFSLRRLQIFAGIHERRKHENVMGGDEGQWAATYLRSFCCNLCKV